MIKYLGSKRLVIPHLVSFVQSKVRTPVTFCDLFSGTARVGHAFKQLGYQVFSNDHNHYAYTLAQCYVECDAEEYGKAAQTILKDLRLVKPKAGYFTYHFCEQAQFFHPKNGEQIDAIRDAIEAQSLPPPLKSVVLVALMEAADRVDSTCGIQMAHLKSWAKRSLESLDLRMPRLSHASKLGKSKAYCLDAPLAAQTIEADIVYLDPPYNQHNYRANYHIWETLVRWDHPQTYGKVHKRLDCQTEKSLFNSKKHFKETFTNVLSALKARYIMISFNNEGFLRPEEIEMILKKIGPFQVGCLDYKRYVGAQIGIYNPKGQKVGQVGHLRNQEWVYMVEKDSV